jgi:predicted alpha/beta hydrolase
MLGWATDPVTGIHYFVRQLWDSKGSFDATTLPVPGFNLYANYCGWALARAHARTGDSVSVFGYIGTSERFGEAIADWATAYADQTERDHAALVAAIERGALPTA